MVARIMQAVDLCPDYSYSFGREIFHVFDHAEGEGLTMTRDQLLEVIAECCAVPGDPVSEYDQLLAINILANHNPEGLAYFMIKLMP